jgi:hypothetical protein
MDTSWWQELLQTLITLGWWQIAVIIILALLVGTLGAAGLVYLILRFVTKDRIRYLDVFGLFVNSLKRVGSIVPQRDNIAVAVPEGEPVPISGISMENIPLTPTVKVETNPMSPDLIVELDRNLTIINEFDGKKLSPLQNRAWLSYLSTHSKLSTDLEFQLEQVYYDLGLWNNVVWMSSELLNRTDFSNKQYQALLFNIAQRIQTIRQTNP